MLGGVSAWNFDCVRIDKNMKLLNIRKLIAVSAVLAASCVGLIAGDMETDGMMMKDGKMMQMKAGTMTEMTQDMTLSDGTMVMKNGEVMMKDGKKMTLKNGDMITMDGKMIPAAEGAK
jgi:hypothetical protein